MNGGKAMKFTEKETFPPTDGLPLTSIYININQLSKSQLKMKIFIKKSVHPIFEMHRLKDKLISNTANIVFFRQ